MSAESMVEVPTPHGPAQVRLHRVRGARTLLFLGHGAGGGIDAPDLRAVTEIALDLRIEVALVLQPYRVAGRRSAAPAAQLDAAWATVVATLRGRRRVLVGGRSSGARVACRTANELGAAGVLCLAFPLMARTSRLPELKAPDCPVLVVQGRNDRFGVPRSGPGRTVVRIAGDHGLKADHDRLREAVRSWLREVG